MLYAISILFLLAMLVILPVGITFAQDGLNATSRFGLFNGEAVSIIALSGMYDLNKWAEVEQKISEGFNIRDIVTTPDRIFVVLEDNS